MTDDDRIDLGSDRLQGAGDEIYAALIAAHDGLSAAESEQLNARLILILINAIGDPETALAAIEAARRSLAR